LPWAAVLVSPADTTGVSRLEKASKSKQRIRKYKKRPSFMNSDLKKVIRAEATVLGVTPKEYIRLAIGIAKNIREGFGSGQEKDAHQLLAMIENPLFVLLLRTVADSFLNQTDSESGNKDTPVNVPVRKPPQTMMPQQNFYPEGWGFW
jgi:hypothetical protein